MDQDADSPTTSWLPPPLTATRRRGPPFSPIIDPVVLIIVVPILALLFLFFFLPPFLTHTSHILKPGSVKSTWDSLNIFLVLFAIICGVLARKNDDVSNSGDVNGIPVPVSNDGVIVQSSGLGSGQWVGFSDLKVGTGGLRRSSSSYPDLRQESLWVNGENRYRFFDDFGIDVHSSPASRFYGDHSRRIDGESEDLYWSTPVAGDIQLSSRRSEADPGELSDVKEIVVDTFEVRPNASDSCELPESMEPVISPSTVSPPAPEPSVPAANSKRHSFRSVGRNVKVEIPSKIESDEIRSYPRSPPPAPPPPPPLPAARMHRSHHKHKKLERKVSDATKEITTAISSLYNQKKRKNKRKLRNISVSSDSSPPSVHSISSPETQVPPEKVVPVPPPPPPPPPPSMFHNIFKKGSKLKKIHSVPATISPAVPPPPPPPPPSSIFNNLFKSGSKSKRFHSPATAPPPPPPPPPSSIMNSLFKNSTKSKRFNSFRAASLPPPPPPPPPMTPPRYSFPVKSKPESTRKNKPQPPSPSPTKPEPHHPRPANSGRPPLPTQSNNYYDRDDFLQSGSQSPFIPMPPPPPPPPFKMPAMKFELRGDFVKIRSTHSSVCSSPDRVDVDFSSPIIDGGDSIGPMPISFPSPDVNAKADSFISRLKDEWRMEKINYVKEKMG